MMTSFMKCPLLQIMFTKKMAFGRVSAAMSCSALTLMTFQLATCFEYSPGSSLDLISPSKSDFKNAVKRTIVSSGNRQADDDVSVTPNRMPFHMSYM